MLKVVSLSALFLRKCETINFNDCVVTAAEGCGVIVSRKQPFGVRKQPSE
jgi:hypothetical protein